MTRYVDSGERKKINERFEFVTPLDRWKCIGCGSCCSSVFSSDWLKFLKDHDQKADELGCCPNLGEENACAIYNKRYNPCRSFPFTLRKRADKEEYRLVIHSGCPGYGKGPLIDIPSRMKRLVKLANKEFAREYEIVEIVRTEDEFVIILK